MYWSIDKHIFACLLTDWPGERVGAARAAVSVWVRAAPLRARGARRPVAGVSAKPGQAEGGPEECRDGEGEDRSPAEAAAELETQPTEQPARHNTTRWIQGKQIRERRRKYIEAENVKVQKMAVRTINIFHVVFLSENEISGNGKWFYLFLRPI